MLLAPMLTLTGVSKSYGDRVLFVDADGELVDGDELIYVIACHRLASGRSDASRAAHPASPPASTAT